MSPWDYIGIFILSLSLYGSEKSQNRNNKQIFNKVSKTMFLNLKNSNNVKVNYPPVGLVIICHVLSLKSQ